MSRRLWKGTLQPGPWVPAVGPFAHCSSWHLGVLSGWTTFSRCPSRVVRIQESIRLRWGSNCTQLIHLQRQPLVIKGVFKVTWQTDFFFPPELVNKLHIMPWKWVFTHIDFEVCLSGEEYENVTNKEKPKLISSVNLNLTHEIKPVPVVWGVPSVQSPSQKHFAPLISKIRILSLPICIYTHVIL